MFYIFDKKAKLIGGGGGEENERHVRQNPPKMTLISDYLAAASSPDALAIINIG